VTILQVAHRGVESITMDREVMRLRDSLGVKFSEMVYYGYWFAPEGEILRKMIDETQKFVTGVARVRLHKGSAQLLARKSQHSLYSQELVTFEADQVYSQKDAEGFIRLNALRLRQKRG
jgi:argininosuccinate synthase